MDKIDQIIEFIVENINDDRISLSKKIKYGFRHYYLTIDIDIDPSSKQSSYHFRDQLELCFDNRNKCIEIYGVASDTSVVIEDESLLEKWSNKFEEILNDDLENKSIKIIETALKESYSKNLYRELQMKKLLREDESL